MKILKHGNPELLKKTKRFRCTQCGCEFEADHCEYTHITDDHYDSYIWCDCPECGGQSLVKRER